MTIAKGTVSKSSTNSNDFYICIMIAGVITNLFQTTQSGEIGN